MAGIADLTKQQRSLLAGLSLACLLASAALVYGGLRETGERDLQRLHAAAHRFEPPDLRVSSAAPSQLDALLAAQCAKQPHVAAAALYAIDGTRLAACANEAGDAQRIPERAIPEGHYDSGGYTFLFEPIDPNERTRGMLFLCVRSGQGDYLRWAVPVAALAALCSAALAYLLWAPRPLAAPKNPDRASSPRAEARADTKADGELELLARFSSDSPHPLLRLSKDGLLLYANAAAAPVIDNWQTQVGAPIPDAWQLRAASVFASRQSTEVALVDDDKRTYVLTLVPRTEALCVDVYGCETTFFPAADDAQSKRPVETEHANHAAEQNQVQMLQAEKMASIGQLAAGVAHELNNPLGFIFANFNTLEEYARDLSALIETYQALEQHLREGDEKEARALLDYATSQRSTSGIDYVLSDIDELIRESREGLERVRDIVANLRDFSHVDRDEKAPVDINSNLDKTLSLAAGEIGKTATVHKEYGQIGECVCYPRELNQVFMGLLLNAAQAIEERGTITLRTYQEDDFICVEIGDTGKGMTPEIKRRIFEPFFTTKDVGSGTGMGLSLAYHTIVSLHGGHILVDSTVGVGTTFTIKIPQNTKDTL